MKGVALALTVTAVGLVCLSPNRTAAQNASLFYSHKASPDTFANARLSYLLSGERTGNGPRDRHLGQPPLLQVPRGSKTCVQIDDSDPLLYDYAIESKTITIAAPEGYGPILASLGAMLGIPAATAKATALQLQAENRSARTPAMVQQQSVIDDYTKAISGIVTAGQKLDSLKKASDVDSINFVAADVAKSDADEANRKANTIFDSNRENPVIQALHAGQISALSTTYALYKQFSDARALGAPQHCINVGESPVHITLKANRKPPSDLSKLTNGAGTTTISESSRPLRPIGDVVGIDVEPVNDKQFEILPVGIITFAVPGAKTFYLDAAKKVQEKPDKGAYFPSAGAVAAFRLTRLVWVGAAAAKGQSGTPDSFVGFLFRNPSIARFFVLGVGAGFASVPTELQGGATLNNELPPSADLSKVIKKSIHVGLSIVVAMTGLSLSK